MARYSFRLNGRPVRVDSWDPDQPLLYLLRNALGTHAPKFGCGVGSMRIVHRTDRRKKSGRARA